MYFPRFSKVRAFGPALALALGMAVTAPAVLAQANIGGSLHGTVTDKTGANIATGTATLSSTDMGTSYKSPLSKTGVYQFSSIPPGKYVLAIESPGFAEAKFTDVVINLNQDELLPVSLAVGAGTTVEVTSEGDKVVTTDTAVVGLFTSETIKNLPLNGRDYQNLVLLSPGVSRSAGGTGQGSGVVASGTRPTNNNYLIDGADNNDPVVPSGAAGGSSGQIGAVPLDEIAEFSVITTNGSAEFGRSSGAIVNVVTKSGTNTIHGTLFEFVRNPKFNTRQWFDPVGFKSALKQNDFGGRFGLPLIKNKTFMAGAYEGYRQRQTLTTTEFLPSLELINTVTNPAFKGLLQSFYPNTISNGGVAITAANFTNTGIGSISQIRKLNNPLDNDGGFVRFDQNWSDRHQTFLTGSISNIVSNGANTAAVLYSGYGSTSRPYHFVLGDNFAISARTINTARVAVQRTAYSFPGEAAPAAALASGASRVAGPYAGLAYSASIASANGVPTLSDTSGIFSALGVPSNFPQGRASNTFIESDELSMVRGKHQFKVGAELRRIQENGYFSNAVRPVVSILDSTLAGFDAATLSSQQQYFFLTGTSNRGFRELEQGYFAQDSWRVTDRFTLELGLRYEIFPPFNESKGLVTQGYLEDANNNVEQCTSINTGQSLNNYVLINSSKYGIKPFCEDFNNFAPRIGFSYDLTGKGTTVLRGGWGEYYDRIFDNVFGNTRFNAPFVAPTVLTAGVYDGTEAPATLSTAATYTAVTIDPNLRTPYTQHFNFTVSQEVTKNTSLTLSYVGAIGRKLFATENPNFGTSFPDAFRPSNYNNVDPNLGVVNPRSPGDLANGIVRGPLGNISYRTSNGVSNFHSLEVTLKHRLANGFSSQIAYTWAHSMDVISDEIAGGTDSASPQSTVDNLLAPYLSPGSTCAAISPTTLAAATNSSAASYLAATRCATGNPTLNYSQAATIFNQNFVKFRPLGANYGDSGFDVKHRLAMNAVYELPFGRGQRFGGNVNGTVNEFIGGWHLTSTVDTQTGTPFIVFSGVDSNRDGTNNDRAIVTSYSNRQAVIQKNTTLYQYPAQANASRYQCPVTAVDPVTRSKTCTDGYNGSVTFNQGFGIVDPSVREHRGLLREPGIFEWDAEVFKNFHVYKESNLRFSTDAFNVLNHPNFGVSGSTLTSSTFGRSSSQRAINQTSARIFQFALKYEF